MMPADNPLAFDAFLSILFAPQASAGSFDEMLRAIQVDTWNEKPKAWANQHMLHRSLVRTRISLVSNPCLFLCVQRAGLPMLLVYGREDPWVRTIWGQRALRVAPEAAYYQASTAMPLCDDP